MIIKTVTFTGADGDVDQMDLYRISQKNSFVEWGILYSETGAGKQRYPNFAKYMQFMDLPFPTSAHLCGKIVRDIMGKGSVADSHKFGAIMARCSRLQLNFNVTRSKVDMTKFLGFVNRYEYENKAFILQVNKSNKPFIEAIAPYTGNEFEYLFDASGGRGTEIQAVPHPIGGKICGYAGGLTAENLEEKLALLEMNLPAEQEIWIDMESGVRTNNFFDLEKVRKCIEIVKPLYEKSKKKFGN